MTESTGLHLRLTAWENIRFHARLFGMRDDVSRKKSETLAVQLGLGSALDRRTEGLVVECARKQHSYVPGPRARVASFGRANGGLDITSARAVRALIASLSMRGEASFGQPDLRAARVCERVMVMHNARLVADGRVDALLMEHDTASMEDSTLR